MVCRLPHFRYCVTEENPLPLHRDYFTLQDYFSHNDRYIIKYLFSLVIKNREICRDGKSLCSYGDFVNNLYKTGINIEVLVNYYYQFAKNGEIVLQFRR